jgi:hypothetical protein
MNILKRFAFLISLGLLALLVGCGGAGVGGFNQFAGGPFNGTIDLPIPSGRLDLPAPGGGPSVGLQKMNISPTGAISGTATGVPDSDGHESIGKLSGSVSPEGLLTITLDFNASVTYSYVGKVKWVDGGRGGPAHFVEGEVRQVEAGQTPGSEIWTYIMWSPE